MPIAQAQQSYRFGRSNCSNRLGDGRPYPSNNQKRVPPLHHHHHRPQTQHHHGQRPDRCPLRRKPSGGRLSSQTACQKGLSFLLNGKRGGTSAMISHLNRGLAVLLPGCKKSLSICVKPYIHRSQKKWKQHHETCMQKKITGCGPYLEQYWPKYA